VVYHGEEVWNHSNNINDLVDAPRALVDQYFLRPFSLIDLNKIEDAELKKRTWLGVMELTLKHIFAQDIQPYLADIAGLMKLIEGEGRAFTEAALIYILDKGNIKDKNSFFNLIKTTLSAETGEKIMTIAEQLKMEGKQEGRQEGRQEGIEKRNLEIAERLLAKQADLSFIAEVTGLSLSTIKELKMSTNKF
jgi:predicted transposase/invertase (TIGR01784 family)